MIFNLSGGGGIPLNFKVVNATMEPTNPTENMIWVNTDVGITGWCFSPIEPYNMSEGEVWFETNESIVTKFNAVKRNNIEVRPAYAYQLISGVFERKDFLIYKDGKWASFENFLYNYGNLGYTWVSESKHISNEPTAGSVAPRMYTDNDGSLRIEATGDYEGGIAYISEKIDLTNYSILEFDGVIQFGGDNYDRGRLFVWTSIPERYWAENVVLSKSAVVNGTIKLDISNLSGDYYFGFGVYHTGAHIKLNYMKVY